MLMDLSTVPMNSGLPASRPVGAEMKSAYLALLEQQPAGKGEKDTSCPQTNSQPPLANPKLLHSS